LRVALDLRLAGYRAGGIARYADELYHALRPIPGLAVRAVRTHRDHAPDPRALRVRTPPHHRIEQYALGAELLTRRPRPQVFHATDFIAPRLPGTPVVATVHDLTFLTNPELLDPTGLDYYRRIFKSKRRTAAWITPSQWTADALVELVGVASEAITVIPHGVPSLSVAASPLPNANRGSYLLAVGTVEPRKRYDLLLDALALLQEPPPLIVVGQPGWRSAATELRLRTTPRVGWRTAVSDDELAVLYRQAWAVAVPSLAEGFGLSALEAMAHGTPVISSGYGALPEVTGPTALAPVDDSAEAWAAALERLRGDAALWQRLADDGYRRSLTFTWQQAAQETAEVYRQVAGW
jgi:glycosyltransferase involved in cell wall biosynthesis